MIINNSYFRYKPLFIPQSVSGVPQTGSGVVSNQLNLEVFIEEKESELLLSFLGYEQYTELLSQLTPDGSFIASPIQKWVDLVEGKDDWRGLRYQVGALGGVYKSLIANYVYFYWLALDNTYYSVAGLQRPESANSTSIMPNDVQAKVWNEFVVMYGYNDTSNWPTFFHNWNGLGMRWNNQSQRLNFVSLYEFMTRNSDVYDTSKFTFYPPTNAFNL